MSMFHVGQLVRCIDAKPVQGRAPIESWPAVGCVYTVRGIYISTLGNECLLLEEVLNERRQYAEGFVEPAFNSRRFVPVKDTSIEVFRSLLSPIPEEVA